MFTAQCLYTTGQVAQQLGMMRSRLAYLVETGQVPQPSTSVPGRRLFSVTDFHKVAAALAEMGEGTPPANTTVESRKFDRKVA